MKVFFNKNQSFPWKNTNYIIGLPRSGKSTVYNILSSCKNTQSIEEPFSLLSIAQKSSCFKVSSRYYRNLLDAYISNAEVLFNELVLGRIYNFRKIDKSYVLNFKTQEDIDFSHSLARQKDVLKYTTDTNLNFIIAMNDVESCLNFITSSMPNPILIRMQRNFIDIGFEIAEKEWLSDFSLSTHSNMTPAYSKVIKFKGKSIFVPYIIPKKFISKFMDLSVLERSIYYAYIQDKILTKNLISIDKFSKAKVLNINFNSLTGNLELILMELIKNLDLIPTSITKKLIDGLSTVNFKCDNKCLNDIQLSDNFIYLMEAYEVL